MSSWCSSIIEALKRELSKKYSKVLHELQGDYLFVLLHNSGDRVVCIKKSEYGYYAKVVDSKSLMLLSCLYAEEAPYGRYVFARDVETLIARIKNVV